MSALSAVPSVTDLASAPGSKKSSTAISNEEAGDRFLKLLVTQLKNQDPMNPMDNAQLTSQMAQINTVSGIEKLNTSVAAMTDKLSSQLAGLNPSSGFDQLQATLQKISGQSLQAQTLQGAGMVGRQVWTAGNTLAIEGGKGIGAFDLASTADTVSVDILSPAGRVIGQLDMGTLDAGRTSFQWDVPKGLDPAGLSFRVNAKAGAVAVKAATQSADRVGAVLAGPDGLMLQLLRTGSIPVANVKAWS